MRSLLSTTAFKIIAAYLFIFVLFAGFVIGWLGFATQRQLTDQLTETITAEVRGLAEQFAVGGIRRLVEVVDERGNRPGASLYLVATFSGVPIAGNIGELPSGTLGRPGWIETDYRRAGESATDRPHRAIAQVFGLPGNFRLLVGRDLEDRDRMRDIFGRGFRLSLLVALVLGLLGAYFVTRRVLKRVDAMTDMSRRIMDGDLTGRLPTGGSRDELDRLAGSVNDMLGRIEALMAGMKEVSDNIAHDLKTPLTRLRNKAEEALRGEASDEAYRAALTGIIEESDGLIRTFNALLMIARAEAGNQRDGMAPVDLGEIARGVGELYEPVADEAGVTLTVAAGPMPVTGSRELLGQVIANLVDNALKYGRVEGQAGEVTVTVAADGPDAVLTVADRGPGIADADRGRVLDRFVRLETSRSRPGSGLGLSLAAAVARLHGGSIALDDNRPGLKVTLRLPRSADDPRAANPSS
ncbi:HAMP domain-containing sensor histidine kinase [Phreatobacter sp.]|uniref:sensor histidine kinase n=1 Tax=Phreatobacter sp. TaxID=1966341 RepID=UPI0022C6A7C9|nr:HAMP domain-containing sensor histidine kinase [Phreatobacter sp.]MCZ8314374.1 HAMP domain-containing sensor histidine kinase [Phreatobacter sp.]